MKFREHVCWTDLPLEGFRHSAHPLRSDSWIHFIEDLYKDFTIEVVQAKRNVNSKADRRGKIGEALIRNF